MDTPAPTPAPDSASTTQLGVDPRPLNLPLDSVHWDRSQLRCREIPNVAGGLMLDHVLSDAECARIIDEIFTDEAMQLAAPVFFRGWASEDDKERRKLGQRVIRRDARAAAEIFERVRPFIPETLEVEDAHGVPRTWRVDGLSERFRLVRYDAGQAFPPHLDGAEVHDDHHRSQLSLVLYLDKGGSLFSRDKDFRGGELVFLSGDMNDMTRKTSVLHKLVPERGLALVFPHKTLHESRAVASGHKYIMRQDILYRCDDAAQVEPEPEETTASLRDSAFIIENDEH